MRCSFAGGLLLALIFYVAASAQPSFVAAAFGGSAAEVAAECSETYPLYEEFCLDPVSSWNITEPAAPVITGGATTCSTAAACETACDTGGRVITFDTTWAATDVQITCSDDDVEIVIECGVHV